jgi:hypothetical protein
MNARHPSAALPTARFSQAQTWTILFLFFTGVTFLSFNYKYLDDLARQHSGTLLRRLLEETTGVYSFFILLPMAFHFAHIYLFERKGWLRQSLMHLATGAGFSIAHTTLMALSRKVLAPLIGLGPYDYGIMTYRYPMEFSNDFIAFTFIIGLYYFFQRMRLAQARELAAAELQTKLAHAQLENLRLQLQPHFLFNTLNTISSIMYEDVRAADAMINQLSDLLRLTLRASAPTKSRFPKSSKLRGYTSTSCKSATRTSCASRIPSTLLSAIRLYRSLSCSRCSRIRCVTA